MDGDQPHQVDYEKDICPDVCVIGMGYVGLSLAATLVEAGKKVIGYEANNELVHQLRRGQPHFFEPDLDGIVKRHVGRTLTFTNELPQRLPPDVVICVGTPLRTHAKEPDLRQIEEAANAVAERMTPETLVVVRSTVPVGTCRASVLPILSGVTSTPLLASCPERTIQGKALRELNTLPQVAGGLDERALRRATELFEAISPRVVPVSSLEAAEMVKLINNCHTDLIYGFGNEVALMAEALGLDASELVNAANLEYPRPDLSKPGFVGGSCLSKDPYLLVHSMAPSGYLPRMVVTSRELNESLPSLVGKRVLACLQRSGCDLAGAKVLVSGFAYKGYPETDDLRGAPFGPVVDLLSPQVGQVVGHDFVVGEERLAHLGVEPATLEEGFTGANAAIILNDHRSYRDYDIRSLVSRMQQPAVLYDAWGVFRSQANGDTFAAHNLQLGYGR